jgi:hypothetical protein
MYISLSIIAMILVSGCRTKEEKSVTEQEVIELIKLFQQHAGSDDVAGERLKAGGEKTKAILIKLLYEPNTPERLVGSIGLILHVYFPSDETYDALDRFVERIEEPEEREKNRQMMKAMRSMPRE